MRAKRRAVLEAKLSGRIASMTAVPGQTVRLTPEPYPMEEMSRVWGLFPTTPYQTSIVYLATPVIITFPTPPPGPPVTARKLRGGVLTGTGNAFGDHTLHEDGP